MNSIFSSPMNPKSFNPPDISTREILWKGSFLDGTLYFIKTSDPLVVDYMIQSYDLNYIGQFVMSKEMILSKAIKEVIGDIKVLYLQSVMQFKAEDIENGVFIH